MSSSAGKSATCLSRPHFAGIFLLSLATLLLELSLTRVLSVANWYHFGFLVVSTALLGFGASGVTLSLWTNLRVRAPLDQALASISLLFSVTAVVSFWLMQHISFEPFRLLVDRWQFANMMLYYVVLAAPFFCSGLAISLLLSRGGPLVNRLYAADLFGAGLGCVAVCLVMPVFGGSGSVAFAATLGALAALAFYSSRSSKLTFFTGAAVAALLVLALVGDRVIPITVIPEKSNHPLMPKGQSPIYTEWNSFSKVDVYPAPGLDPDRPDPGFLSIMLDAGGAGTGMDDLSMGVRKYLATSATYRPAGVPYAGKQHPKVLIIGSGAGREVLEALYYQASSITAVEINPIITDLVTRRMSKHWGGLFEQPEVHLVTEDGRSFVRRSKEKYDIIMCINTFSETALSTGALTLSETYLLTRDAFQDYWEHLNPDGTLLITDYNLAKLFATTRELFDELRLGSPADHIFAFRGTIAPFGRRRLVSAFLLQKSPLHAEDVTVMAQRAGINAREHWIGNDRPDIYYSPFHRPADDAQILLSDILRSPKIERVYASTNEYLRPATDDRPFFNQSRAWGLHLGFRDAFRAGRISRVHGSYAQITLVVMLIQAIIVAGALILFPLARFGRQGLQTRGRWAFLTYFAALGLGFILIEIVLLQWLLLFLGQPIYTFSVVLASLLIFTGLGSWLAGLIRNITYDLLSRFLLGGVLAILFTLFITPPVLSWTLGWTLPWRVAISILLVAPLGVMLGIPFSTGLRLLSNEAPPLVPWAWAVNGFFTVIGSVTAMILGMAFGFTVVFLVAAACYLMALFAILRAQHAVVPRPAYHSPGFHNNTAPNLRWS